MLTIENGAHDALDGCDFTSPACPFRTNFSATLGDLQAALANDPGSELLIAMAYPNPGVGTPDEAGYDQTLLGASAKLSCADTGAELGLNDIIAQGAARHDALLANPYPAFKRAGQAFIKADGVHPNDAGAAAIAEAFVNAVPPCVAPKLKLKARKQGLKKKLTFSATVDADSTLVAKGKAIKETADEVAANEKTKVKAKLKRKRKKKLAKKLDRMGRAKTRIKATVTSEAGGTATDKVKVKFKD